MTHLAIMKVETGRVAKYAEFDSEAEALAHVAAHLEAWPDAFVAERPPGGAGEWFFDGNGFSTVPLAPTVPNRVSARQFKMALHNAGLLSSVEGWIASQGGLVQIAYENSGTFVRDEPMMQAGFAALGFSEEQIDAFLSVAAAT